MSEHVMLNLYVFEKNMSIVIKKSETVKDLYTAARKKIDGGLDLDFILIALMRNKEPTELDESSSALIGSLPIVTGNRVTVCLRAGGGIRKLTPLPGYIEVTTSPCDFTLDSDPSIDRAKMPCGCIIDPEELKRLCEISINDGKFAFSCPNCNVSWQLQCVLHVLSAVMTEDELEAFNSKIIENFIAKQEQIKKCPSCKNFLVRDPKKSFLNVNWVRCPLCTYRSGKNVEFCWVCLQPWKGDSNSCGNEGCTGVDLQLQFLQICETKKIGKVDGVPSVRCCVKCGNLINHTEACKHMTCRCGYSFCFICLKPCVINSGWQCGGAFDPCEVAPRQLRLYETEN